ncbi:class I SAM-dependent methyltransferase [Devosia sp.]|uniref:class I SAM-dependent methyltransferase n=1 Tax=Devosia sp. TaxID=1871048 RepID=UPI002FC747BB
MTAASSSFWDRLADQYARQPIADEAAYQTKLRVTRSYFRPDMSLLELGCGTGGTAISHAPFVAHIRALDFSERMLDIARAKARAAGVDNVTFEQADISALLEPPGSYDMVLGLSILHLLKDPDAVIGRVHAMLKPDGLFITSTACIGDTMAALKFIAPLGRAFGLLPQLHVMTGAELLDKFTRAGFTIAHQWLPGRGKALFVVAQKQG